MRQDSCITSLEDLKQWFMMNQAQGDKQPYFTVWRGNEAKQDRVIFRNEEQADPEEAWSMMENMMEMHTGQGGLFRIYITSKPKFNYGLTTLYKIQGQQMAGIGSGMGMSGMYGIYGSIGEMVAAEVNKEKKLWELERRLEDMQAAQDATVSKTDQLLEEFMPVLKDLGHKFGLRVMGFGPSAGMPAAAAIHGNPATDVPPADGYDYDRIEPALDNLRQVFPDTEGTVEKLSIWATQNPDLARQLLQTI